MPGSLRTQHALGQTRGSLCTDKKREGKRKKKKFKCRNENDLFFAFHIKSRYRDALFSHFVYIPFFACGGLKMTNFPATCVLVWWVEDDSSLLFLNWRFKQVCIFFFWFSGFSYYQLRSLVTQSRFFVNTILATYKNNWVFFYI